jgi:ParB family chromosome partitioning protein
MTVRSVEEAIREHEHRDDEPAPAPGSTGSSGFVAPSTVGPIGALRPAGLVELEELLSDHLDTRVRVSMANSRGKVVVEFANLEDLERIYRLMTEGRPPGA